MMSSASSGRFSPFGFDSKPPTPPPKDPIYQQQIRLSTAPSSHLMTDGSSTSTATTKKPPLGFFKFPKKSPTRFGELVPPPPGEDEGISLPWNFQHNIHVDEGFIGLPPSWSSSLASQGFTEEEIFAIQARRLGARSPQDLRYLYTDRPTSPAPGNFLYRRPSTATTNSSITSSPAVDSTISYAAQSPTLSITPTISSGSQTSIRRNMLALPAADDVGMSMMVHRPNQPSISTVAYSSDSHAPTTSSQSHTASQSQSSREESALPKEKKSFWGQSRTKPSKEKLSVFSNLVASSSTPNLGGGFPSSKDPHPPPVPPPPPPNPNHQHLFSSSHSQASVSTSSLSVPSSSSSAITLSSTSTPTTWNLKASASSLAAAVGAVKSSAGKGVLKVLRGKTGGGGGSPVSGSSTEAADLGSVGGRGKSKIRMSDETFFALDHEHDQFESGRDTIRPTVWELYMKPKIAGGGSGTAGTTRDGPPHPTQFVSGTTAAAALAEAAAAAGWSTTRSTAAPNSQASSRNGSLHRKGSGEGLARSKSYGSLRSQRSLGSQASSSSTHTVGMPNATTHTNANANANAVANTSLTPNTQNSHTHIHINAHTNTNTIPNAIQKPTTRKQRPHMLGKHKQSGSVTSLDSIPEASPAPGAVLGVPGGGTGASSNPSTHFNHHRNEQNYRLGGGQEYHKHSASVASASSSTSASTSASTSSSNSNSKSTSKTSPFGLSTHNGTGTGTWASASSSRAVDLPPPQSTSSSTTATATLTLVATQNASPPPLTSTAPRLSLPHQHSGNDSLSLSTWWTEAVLTGMAGADMGGWDENGSVGGGGQGGREKKREEGERRDGTAGAPPNAPVSGLRMGKQQQQEQQRQGQGQLVGGASSSTQSKNHNNYSGSASTNSTPPRPILNTSNGNHNSRGMSPSRVIRKNGQPLPLSKPPPRHPAPDPPVPGAQAVSMTLSSSSGMGGLGAGQGQDQKQKFMHPQSTVVRINAAIAAASANASMRPTVALPTTPRPLPSIAAASASAPPPLPVLPSIQGPVPSTSISTGLGCTASNPNNNPNALPFQSEGLLSPPPTGGWKSLSTSGPGAAAGNGGATILSPGSSTGPDSAQLWNEIEQMMDPSMMSTIPGLHFSTALPPGARDVLESARVLGGGFGTAVGTGGGAGLVDAKHDAGGVVKTKDVFLPSDGVKTVGDLVGKSPPGSAEGEHGGNGEEEDGGGESDESDMLLDDDPYESVVQSVIARPSVEPLSLSSRTGRLAQTTQAPLVKVSRSRSRGKGEGGRVDQGLLSVEKEEANRDSIRSSTSTITIAGYASPPRIVRAVSVVRRTGAYVIDKSKTDGSIIDLTVSSSSSPAPSVLNDLKQSTSSPSGSSDGSVFSGSSGSPMQENLTPTTDAGIASPLFYYLDGTQTPSPRSGFDLPGVVGNHNTRGGGRFEYDDDVADVSDAHRVTPPPGGLNSTRPTIVINDSTSPIATSPSTETIPLSGATPLSPFQRYRGWLSAVVAPLEAFIDESVDPREHYLNLREIAEGESGSVFAAHLNAENAEKLRLEPLVKAQDGNAIASGQTKYVAIKSIAIVPSGSGSPKLVDLQRELTVMKGCAWHEHVLGMDAIYVDLVEDSLWVRMELMERSLADLIGLVEEGLMLQDRMMARFAGDVLLALDYLLTQNIAHRDVRSDNLLINQQGFLKLADFANAVKVSSESFLRDDVAGVAFWQAPEIRQGGPYDALKVDVWSLGATVWEMAQTEPPFADTKQLAERWPPLRQPELYSPAFHEFLRKCSEPAASRPSATELLKSPFVKNACGRPVIIQLLAQCVAIEKSLQDRNDTS